MTDRQYWAEFNGRKVGPFTTRDDAVSAMMDTITKPPRGMRRPAITTGYGIDGAAFDIRFYPIDMSGFEEDDEDEYLAGWYAEGRAHRDASA